MELISYTKLNEKINSKLQSMVTNKSTQKISLKKVFIHSTRAFSPNWMRRINRVHATSDGCNKCRHASITEMKVWTQDYPLNATELTQYGTGHERLIILRIYSLILKWNSKERKKRKKLSGAVKCGPWYSTYSHYLAPSSGKK